jgi:serine protease inhibitor
VCVCERVGVDEGDAGVHVSLPSAPGSRPNRLVVYSSATLPPTTSPDQPTDQPTNQGSWEHAFDAKATEAAPFHLTEPHAANPREVHAPMMFKKFSAGQAGYTFSEGQFSGVRLPYKGGQYAAVALLPDPGAPGGVAGLLGRIASDRGLVEGLRWGRSEVLVWMPRFKLECQMSLKE